MTAWTVSTAALIKGTCSVQSGDRDSHRWYQRGILKGTYVSTSQSFGFHLFNVSSHLGRSFPRSCYLHFHSFYDSFPAWDKNLYEFLCKYFVSSPTDH